MRARLVAISLTLASVVFLIGGATAQAPFRDGAFVLGQDGYGYVVSGGVAYPIAFASDDAGVIPSLVAGPPVANVADVPLPASATSTAAAPSPASTATAAPAAGTRENPMPVGTVVTLTDGWQVKVLSTIPNATSQVLARSSGNKPPDAGRQFFIVRLSATYTGSDSAHFGGDYRLRLVGGGAVSYSTFTDRCGSIPDELADPEVFTGGTVTGNLCWSVLTGDVGTLVLYDESAPAGKRVYLALP